MPPFHVPHSITAPRWLRAESVLLTRSKFSRKTSRLDVIVNDLYLEWRWKKRTKSFAPASAFFTTFSIRSPPRSFESVHQFSSIQAAVMDYSRPFRHRDIRRRTP